MEFLVKISDDVTNFTDHVEIMQKRKNGVIVGEYKMSLENFVASISEAVCKVELHETPFLPSNCIKLLSNAGKDIHTVFIEMEKRMWQVNYDNRERIVGFPRMIFRYDVVSDTISRLTVFAIKDSFITDSTELYRFPYANVHPDSGVVCMGSNTFPKIEDLTQLQKMHYLFFAAPFGNDYGSTNAKGKSLSEMFDLFEDKEFDNDFLVPLQKTLDEVIKQKNNA